MTVTLIDDFNSTIDFWIYELEKYSFDQLCEKPKDDGWSIGQVYVHLISASKYHVSEMKAALTSNENSGGEMTAEGKEIFARNGFPDIRISNSIGNANTGMPESSKQINQELLAIKEDVNDLWRRYDFAQNKGKVKHPGLSYFSAAEWLKFTEMHMRHHMRQKKRIDSELGFDGLSS